MNGFIEAKCTPSIAKMGNECQKKQASALVALAKLNQTKEAFGSLLSKATPYLIGGAVGAGAMALMGGKKGGDGGGTPAPATKPDEKLRDLNLNRSSSSAASTPSVVYYPPSNNNGSLGNPAVTGSTTSTSTPADTVTIAGITPSTSFSSGQGSPVNTDTNSNRTIGGSGAAAPSSSTSASSGGGGAVGSIDPGRVVSGASGSDSASLVDSGKSAGGGGSFSGMDGGSGSGSSAQAASADGTMLTGIPGGKSDPQSTKLKALASKKAQVAQTQPSTTNTKPLVRRRLATPPVKVAPPKNVNVKEGLKARGVL
jgi:hypothetical protein